MHADEEENHKMTKPTTIKVLLAKCDSPLNHPRNKTNSQTSENSPLSMSKKENP
jgi:hypothetical protein